MTDLRRILLTGATRGLGRVMALRFAELGHQVVGCGRDSGRIDELRQELDGAHRFDAVDVADDAAVAAWAGEVLADVGAPDLLLNNAAVVNKNAPLWEVPAEEFSQVVDTNIKGVTNVIRAFLPAMIERGRGVVVNFSSGWGRSTAPEVAPYCATKFAIEGLTQALAQELPEGLVAVPLSPGIIDTDMLRSTMGEVAGSYPSPDEWAKVAVPYILGLGSKDNGSSLRIPFN